MNPPGLWEEEAAPDALDGPPADESVPVAVSTADWRTRQFLRFLSPARRVVVATRPRFYTMPWLRRTGEPDEDDLPL